jgi:hypothetical protein
MKTAVPEGKKCCICSTAKHHESLPKLVEDVLEEI